MVVGIKNGSKYVKAATIVASINDQTGQTAVLIQADKISIDGDTLVTKISGMEANFTNLTTGITAAGSIRANQLAAGTSFTLEGKYHHNSTITIGGINYNIVTWNNS